LLRPRGCYGERTVAAVLLQRRFPGEPTGFDERKTMPPRDHEIDQRHRAKAARNRAATGAATLICECADLRCNATLAATAADYAKRSSGAHGFWVRPGHEIASLERVVEHNEDYAVVQKLVGTSTPVITSRIAATH
jgi:hypothetical protein